MGLYALALLAVLALQGICSFLQSYGFSVVGESALLDIRRDTYSRMIRMPLSFHVRRRVGELASRLATDLTQIREMLVFAAPHFLREFVVLAGGVVLIGMISVRLVLVMLISVPPAIVLSVAFARLLQRNSRMAQDRLADTSIIVEETLQGMTTVKAFTSERREELRYRQSLAAYRAVVLRGALWQAAFVSFIVFLLFGAAALVLWYAARLVLSGELTAGQLMSFLWYTIYVAAAMRSLAELLGQVQRTLGATQRVREVMRESPERVDPPGGQSVVTAAGRLRGQVAFQNVRFRYPSRPEVEVLRDVTLTIEPGQRVALVGPSASGKSTLVSLLLGFYEPEAGAVLLDGHDARQLALYGLRRQVAVVPQDVLLLGGTIAENIAYGRPTATEEEVIAAARRANAHDFICAFPDGYRTRVGERGTQLSGGQRQRIAIARALLRDPAVLILDEATSALDAESEGLVLQALEGLMEGRTSLVIAHRLSTIRRADRICVMKDGQIVEAGTHDELVARADGAYRALSQLQMHLGCREWVP